MRLALPNAAFIGFTGTPLFKQDQLTKRIFGKYVSRYDFKRSEEDGATVGLVYENRGEKLGVARPDLNDRIADRIEEAELDPDQEALLEKLLGQDYEVITADERLDRIAADFVEHCATRWQSGKSMLVCVEMKAHSLMQAIARTNRVWPGKDFGLIVDYNGMLRSLREALAQYALGDDGAGDEEIVAPVEERVQALVEATEAHLRGLGFDPATLIGSTGFTRIKGLKDAVDAVHAGDEARRRFEVLARQVFVRFKALLMEPSAFPWAERHDNIEAIRKKLSERRDTADVTELLKALHRIVNEAIRTQTPGDDQAEGLTLDLSRIDMDSISPWAGARCWWDTRDPRWLRRSCARRRSARTSPA